MRYALMLSMLVGGVAQGQEMPEPITGTVDVSVVRIKKLGDTVLENGRYTKIQSQLLDVNGVEGLDHLWLNCTDKDRAVNHFQAGTFLFDDVNKCLAVGDFINLLKSPVHGISAVTLSLDKGLNRVVRVGLVEENKAAAE